jgi:hypothetical protein
MPRTYFGILTDKEITEITVIAFPYCFAPWFSTLIGGSIIIQGTIKTTPHIPMTLGTDFLP